MNRASLIAGLAVCLGFCGSASATLIDTTLTWDGNDAVGSFGEGGPILTGPTYKETFGQTFTVPVGDNVLDSFSFWLTDPDTPVTFAAYVMLWDESELLTTGRTHATGSVLYKSDTRVSTSGGNGTNLLTEYFFDTGDLILVEAEKYVVFLSASEFFDGSPDRVAIGNVPDAYDGGYFVINDNGNDFSALTSRVPGWSNVLVQDLVVRMDFSSAPIPEPTTLALMALGIAGIGFTRRRAGAK